MMYATCRICSATVDGFVLGENLTYDEAMNVLAAHVDAEHSETARGYSIGVM